MDHATLTRKARNGRRDWISWRDKTGAVAAMPYSPTALKAALLAVGTQGRFTLIAACSATRFTYRWRDGIRMIRNARYGC
ncbi:hypothetical protein [Methylobacterium sp. Gmos1]